MDPVAFVAEFLLGIFTASNNGDLTILKQISESPPDIDDPMIATIEQAIHRLRQHQQLPGESLVWDAAANALTGDL